MADSDGEPRDGERDRDSWTWGSGLPPATKHTAHTSWAQTAITAPLSLGFKNRCRTTGLASIFANLKVMHHRQGTST